MALRIHPQKQKVCNLIDIQFPHRYFNFFNPIKRVCMNPLVIKHTSKKLAMNNLNSKQYNSR